MLKDGWDKKPGVRIVFGRWQDHIDTVGQHDAVFFDTFDDVGHLREFHQHLDKVSAFPCCTQCVCASHCVCVPLTVCVLLSDVRINIRYLLLCVSQYVIPRFDIAITLLAAQIPTLLLAAYDNALVAV
jgi:hypothetical protein